MHELAATESLLHTAIKAAEEGGAEKILKIQVGIGRYSGILQEYVRKYYEIAAKGTIAEKAELEFRFLPVRLRCTKCGTERTAGILDDGTVDENSVCPSCGSGEFTLMPENWDLYVDRVEVE